MPEKKFLEGPWPVLPQSPEDKPEPKKQTASKPATKKASAKKRSN